MFGIDDNIGKPAVEAAAEKLGPLFAAFTNRVGDMFHGLLDRVNGTEVNVRLIIPPRPKNESDPQ
jgi:hypothetical protein